MALSEHEKRHLAQALRLYEEGSGHRADYQLWVGFGDGWTKMKARLISRGYIRIVSSGVTELSTKGSGFFDQICRSAA